MSADETPIYKTEVPLGLALVLPTARHEGVLLPIVHLEFDPTPVIVISALIEPKTLTVDWPITGSERNLRSQSLPCILSWKVKPNDAHDVRFVLASREKTEVKIDGQGKFKVLVGGKPPKFDLVSAGLVQEGMVGFSIAISDPPDVPVQANPTMVPYALTCDVNVHIESDLYGPIDKALFGDTMCFSGETNDVLKGRSLMLKVVEQDTGDLLPEADEQAWSKEFGSGGIKPCAWSIGFSDKEGSFGQFSYADTYEEGDFEYGWILSALDAHGERVDILKSKQPIVVKKPRLESFFVEPADPERGQWRVQGKIANFAPGGPRIRVGLKLVDRQGQSYPDGAAHMAQAQLDVDGSFSQTVTGPTSPPLIGPMRMPVYAILCLLPTLTHPRNNSIAGFLDYDEDQYALYHNLRGPCWFADTLWICSAEWSGLVSRTAKPKSGRRGAIEPPGPSAGGDQSSDLTFEEIYLDICAWEGVVRHMYLDSNGYVTVGAGKCLHKVEEATALEFKHKEGDNEATADESLIKRVFNMVSKMPAGKHWAEYATSPLLVLDNGLVRSLAEDYAMNHAVPHLAGVFPKFHQYPKAARRAIVDVSYNCGIYFFDKKTLRIRAAILAEDWEFVFRDVHRIDCDIPVLGRWRKRLCHVSPLPAQSIPRRPGPPLRNHAGVEGTTRVAELPPSTRRRPPPGGRRCLRRRSLVRSAG